MIASASDCSTEGPGTTGIAAVAALVQVSTTPLASVSQVHAGSMDTTEIPTAAVTGTGMMSRSNDECH